MSADYAAGRRGVIEDRYGDWTIRIYDDQPIAEDKKYAADNRVVIAHKGVIENEFPYPAYRIWTLLAHWHDDLPDIEAGDVEALDLLIEGMFPTSEGFASPKKWATSVADQLLASAWLADLLARERAAERERIAEAIDNVTVLGADRRLIHPTAVRSRAARIARTTPEEER